MKFTLVLAAATAVSAGILETRQFPGMGSAALGPISAAMGLGGKTGGGFLRKTTQLQATGPKELGARRVKVRYGPYSIPGKDRGAIGKMMDGEGGMAWNLPDRNVQKPCTDCMITYIAAGLENLQGKSVNTVDGLWLHHMVSINQGRGLKDATCGGAPLSLPHIDVGTSARTAERWFASGNERTITDMTPQGANLGYYVGNGDKFHFIVELMNMNKASKKVYMTLTYEYVPGAPRGWSNTRPVWLDVAQCGLSDVEPKSQDGPFDIKARTWRANFPGRLIGMGGHLHDGGIYLDIIQNGRKLCRAQAEYKNGDMGGMGGGMGDMGGGMGGEGGSKKKFGLGSLLGKKFSRMTASTQRKDATVHISSISYCGAINGELGNQRVGDRWDITGHYDYQKQAGMLRINGKQSDVMAIAVMMVAVPMESSRRR